ncbi:TolC family protein [Phocaeicola coprocola]|jgi:outer membrane protein
MSKTSRLIVLCSAVLCSQYLCAQSRTMGIEEMFRLADENSKSIQAFRTGKEVADENLKAAKAQRLPDISASLSGSYWGNGKLWNRDFSNATKIEMPHWGNNFALEAQLAVYAGGAISSGIELAELEKQLAEMDWQKNRQDIRFLLVGHYLNLYKLNNQIEVLHKNLELTDQIIANMQARLEQGTALQNDITRYELQRETLRLQLAKVEDACKIANHQLVITLHLPEGTVVQPDTTLNDSRIQTLSEANWQELAAQNNLNLQQAETGIKINRQREKLERSERLPKISLMAAEHLDGPITIEVPVLDNNFNYWFVGVGVKYNISSLFKNNRKLKAARLNVRKAQETYELAQEQTNHAVQESYVNFLTSFTDLRTQQKSVELADENYSVTSNRYQNDLALLTDMLDASNIKLSADMGLVNARINVIFNYYKMKYITHTL